MNSKNRYFVGICLLAIYSVFFVGCDSYKIPVYQPIVSAPTQRIAQQSGVVVALDPFVERERTARYFNLDAITEGIAILHVSVTNKTVNHTFLVERKNIQLILAEAAGGLTADGKKIERSTTDGETLHAIGGSGIIGMVGASMISHALEIQRNFTNKEMGDQTLSPGQNMEGFIYFTPVRKGENWARSATVKVNLTETKTHDQIELNVRLSQ